jgi:hypothetical protein
MPTRHVQKSFAGTTNKLTSASALAYERAGWLATSKTYKEDVHVGTSCLRVQPGQRRARSRTAYSLQDRERDS